jgi:transglutaminase-like putative cysteine protease
MPSRNQRFLRCCLIGLAGAAALLPALGWSRPPDTVPTSRAFAFTYTVEVPALPAGSHQLRLWVPLPRSDRYQKVSALRIESPIPYRIHRSKFGNRAAYFVIQGARAKRPVEIRVHFRAMRLEHRAELDPPDKAAGAPANPPADLERYLAPDQMIPLSGIIAKLSEETTQGVTDPMEKARRIYEYVIAHMRYDKSGSGWGRGDAVWACSSHRGNCTDFHSLFIGMARAAGIPARFQIGFPLPEEKHEGTIPGYHCWAEFYLKDAGWVPVDASEAWLNPKRHDFYFGALDPSRVLFTRGRDLELSPPQKAGPLNYFIYPYAEVDGKPFSDVQHKFSFRDLPAKS